MKKQHLLGLACVFVLSGSAFAQPASRVPQTPQPGDGPSGTVRGGVAVPAGYVIGAEDVLSVIFWRERDMSADVVVRPDGKISVPLLDDVQAAGDTPEELSAALEKAAAKLVAEPDATVVVKEIHSRRVFVVGRVVRPGTFPLASEMNVLQAIAMAGGFMDYADQEHVLVIRFEKGREERFRFNYKDVINGRNIHQNLSLKPGDTVVVK